MQLNNNIKVNKKYNIYFTDIKTFKEKLKNEYLYEFILGKKIKEENLKYFEVSYFFNDIFKYKFFKPIKKGKIKTEIEIYYMVHYLEKDEEYLKKQKIKIKKCVAVKGETFKEIEKDDKKVEQIFYYYNKFYVSKDTYKGYVKCKNSYIVLLKLKIRDFKHSSKAYRKDKKITLLNYKQQQKKFLYSYKSNIYYQWINKKEWGKVKNFNYLNYDRIKKDKYNIYYIPVINFYNKLIKFYENIFKVKNQKYLFNWIYMEVEASLINSILSEEFKNYFIYTCILKEKKIYKKYIKYKIEFMLHINELDIEYMYLMNKNDPYFFYFIKNYPAYYSKEYFYDRFKNCDIIKKEETLTLENAYLKYMYKNEKKRSIIIKEKKKKIKSKFLWRMKKFNYKMKKINEVLKV